MVVDDPQAAPANPVVAFPYTGDYRIDTLLDNPLYRWNADSPMGTPVTVSYSFMTLKPFYGGTDTGGDRGFSAFTQQQKEATRGVLNRLANETGLKFVEVNDSASSYGQLRFGNNTQSSSAGYAYLPGSTGDDLSGDVWLDRSISSNLTNLPAGSYAYATLVHEIGHALGLKHPGNYNAGESSTPQPGNYLGVAEDNTAYTIMSYTDAANGLQREWYGIYDLLTLRTLYGSGTAGGGNSTYSYGNAAGNSMTTLFDSGGIDTLRVDALTIDSVVDLRPGAFSSIGQTSSGRTAENNVSIDLSTTIENFVGSSRNDSVVGNSANNSFTLGLGTNSANGGAGIDTAVYTGAAASYQIGITSSAIQVSGQGTIDTLSSVERLVFSNKKIALDISGNAGSTAKILGAVFGKEAVAIKEYVAIGLNLLDGGMSYSNLVQLALNARLGTGASNTDVVTVLYTNLVGQAPDAASLALYKGLIDSGSLSQAGLGVIAADHVLNTTNINLVGLAATGLDYI